MTNKFIKYGNQWSLIIHKPLLDTLGIDDTTDLDISATSDSIVIKPLPAQPLVIKKRQDILDRSAYATMDQYEIVFKKLSTT